MILLAGPEGTRRMNRMMACIIISGQHSGQDSLLIELTDSYDIPCSMHSSTVL